MIENRGVRRGTLIREERMVGLKKKPHLLDVLELGAAKEPGKERGGRDQCQNLKESKKAQSQIRFWVVREFQNLRQRKKGSTRHKAIALGSTY